MNQPQKIQNVVTLFFPPFCVRRLLRQELEMATRVK